MRALSMTQPWATLVAIGAKLQETRSWGTGYRGEIAIHAAKGFPPDARALCHAEPFCRVLIANGIAHPDELERGAIIAVTRLIACDEIDEGYAEAVRDCSADRWLPPYEFEFGDYAIGRYSWALENVRELSTPVPCRGALGLWTVPDDVERQVRASLLRGAA